MPPHDIVRGMNAPDLAMASARLAAFATGWSLEAAHPGAADIDALAAAAPPATEIYLTAVPNQPRQRVVEAVARLNAAGLQPVPHIAARQFEGEAELAAFLQGVSGAGAGRALVIAGDRDMPAGPYPDALAVIASGLLQRHGIRCIGIGGYPDGHPRISAAALARALADKLAAAREGGLDVRIVTQFCFDAETIVAWLRRLRDGGVMAPVRIGIAGPTSMASLLRYAARCGVRASARGLARNASAMRGLIGQAAPDALLHAVVERLGGLGPVSPHFYSFGGIARTAAYARAAAVLPAED